MVHQRLARLCGQSCCDTTPPLAHRQGWQGCFGLAKQSRVPSQPSQPRRGAIDWCGWFIQAGQAGQAGLSTWYRPWHLIHWASRQRVVARCKHRRGWHLIGWSGRQRVVVCCKHRRGWHLIGWSGRQRVVACCKHRRGWHLIGWASRQRVVACCRHRRGRHLIHWASRRRVLVCCKHRRGRHLIHWSGRRRVLVCCKHRRGWHLIHWASRRRVVACCKHRRGWHLIHWASRRGQLGMFGQVRLVCLFGQFALLQRLCAPAAELGQQHDCCDELVGWTAQTAQCRLGCVVQKEPQVGLAGRQVGQAGPDHLKGHFAADRQLVGQLDCKLVNQAVAKAGQADCQPAAVSHAKHGAKVQPHGVVHHCQADQQAVVGQQNRQAGCPPHGSLKLGRLAAAQNGGWLVGQPGRLAVQAYVAVLVPGKHKGCQLAARQVVAGRAARAAVFKQPERPSWLHQTGQPGRTRRCMTCPTSLQWHDQTRPCGKARWHDQASRQASRYTNQQAKHVWPGRHCVAKLVVVVVRPA